MNKAENDDFLVCIYSCENSVFNGYLISLIHFCECMLNVMPAISHTLFLPSHVQPDMTLYVDYRVQ